jgi:hypothetical protein
MKLLFNIFAIVVCIRKTPRFCLRVRIAKLCSVTDVIRGPKVIFVLVKWCEWCVKGPSSVTQEPLSDFLVVTQDSGLLGLACRPSQMDTIRSIFLKKISLIISHDFTQYSRVMQPKYRVEG